MKSGLFGPVQIITPRDEYAHKTGDRIK